MLHYWLCWDMVGTPSNRAIGSGTDSSVLTGGTLVTRGEISVGDLTSLLLYTVYVGSGLQMLTYVLFQVTCVHYTNLRLHP